MKRNKNRFSSILTLSSILIFGLAFGYGLSLFEENTSQIKDQTTQAEIEQKNNDTEMEPNLVDLFSPKPGSIDKDRIENSIFVMVNTLRDKLGSGTVTRNETLRLAADIRAIETEETFSHTRPNGEEPFSVLEELETSYPYYMVGENLAMATYFRDEDHMAELIFNGWVDSPDHYQTMINPEFEEIGIGVHYNGEILYVTQFFGTSR